jgi:hypothetical protein
LVTDWLRDAPTGSVELRGVAQSIGDLSGTDTGVETQGTAAWRKLLGRLAQGEEHPQSVSAFRLSSRP